MQLSPLKTSEPSEITTSILHYPLFAFLCIFYPSSDDNDQFLADQLKAESVDSALGGSTISALGEPHAQSTPIKITEREQELARIIDGKYSEKTLMQPSIVPWTHPLKSPLFTSFTITLANDSLPWQKCYSRIPHSFLQNWIGKWLKRAKIHP